MQTSEIKGLFHHKHLNISSEISEPLRKPLRLQVFSHRKHLSISSEISELIRKPLRLQVFSHRKHLSISSEISEPLRKPLRLHVFSHHKHLSISSEISELVRKPLRLQVFSHRKHLSISSEFFLSCFNKTFIFLQTNLKIRISHYKIEHVYCSNYVSLQISFAIRNAEVSAIESVRCICIIRRRFFPFRVNCTQ